jgi:hypothetical protein
LLNLLEQPAVVSGLINCRLKLLAQLREPFEALPVGTILVECRRAALIRDSAIQYKKYLANAIPERR